ncbi:gas vesicle protein [Nocardioides sp. URHA0032]|uniref:gas vesicle protein n=1 Tax=Nocardioides sp. URHA0032 TaxID=1380388 RepID=UPI000687302A|nr:gas vesicle protein [Nocardioides sp. URHA0032]
MTEQQTGDVPSARPYYQPPSLTGRPQPANLADILERVLDKGIIIAGDIRVNLLDIELLTIKLRLLVVSVDKAEEMGIDWWKHDPMLTVRERGLDEENRELRERLAQLEGTPDDEEGGQDEGDGSARGRQSAGSRSRGDA